MTKMLMTFHMSRVTNLGCLLNKLKMKEAHTQTPCMLM